MKSASIYPFFFAILIGVTAYLASDNYIVGGAVGVVSLGAAFFLYLPMIRSYALRERKRHECYQFVNSFLITLSVCQSVDHAYEVASGGIEGEFAKLQTRITGMDDMEKVRYLRSYFQMEIYAMFVSVLELYLERGGDVLALSSELLNELARIEENGRNLMSRSAKNAIQFGLMWLIALAVIVFVRFGLNTFFARLKGSWTFLGGVAAFYGFFLVSLGIYLHVYTSGERKEKLHGKLKR